MTVQVRGATSASSGTIAVPAGVVAGDVLILLARSFYQDNAISAPWGGLSGWTVQTNSLYSDWGILVASRTATASEPASYTVTANGGEAIIGGMVAVYSDTGQGMLVNRSGTNSGPFSNLFRSSFVPARPAGSLFVHVFQGNATAITAYSGFTGTRTHHATLGLHSEIPHSTLSPPSGPPYYFERYRDIVMSIDTESGTLTAGDRIATSNFAWGLYPPAAPGDPNDGTYWSNTLVTITESGVPPVVGGWTGWIID